METVAEIDLSANQLTDECLQPLWCVMMRRFVVYDDPCDADAAAPACYFSCFAGRAVLVTCNCPQSCDGLIASLCRGTQYDDGEGRCSCLDAC